MCHDHRSHNLNILKMSVCLKIGVLNDLNIGGQKENAPQPPVERTFHQVPVNYDMHR